ncbi:MAG: FAD-dependent oxidoreductase [Myxococcota bacterium]
MSPVGVATLWKPGDGPLRGVAPPADGFATADRDIDCDVVIVGTGPGGAACARALALAGAKVWLVEEGPAESRFRPNQGHTMRHHMQEGGGMVATGSTFVPIAAGRGVGGGSLINSAIAWRCPDYVLDGWTKALGDDRYSPANVRPVYDELWELLGIGPTRPEIGGRNNALVVRGVEKLGLEGGWLDRATPGCVGCGVCYFGCPSLGKASVNLNLLVDAVAAGARIQAETKVTEVLVEGGRAVGVRGRMRHADTNEPGGLVTVRAERVVIAAGGIGTPRLLHVAGLELGPAVGKGLHIHPGNAVLGWCDEPVELWKGATQGAWFHCPDLPGVLPHTFSAPPEACVSAAGATGADAKRMLERLEYLCGLVVMISDTGEGAVSAWGDGRARITYDFAESDVVRIRKGMEWAAKVLLAGGATEVFAPVFGVKPCRTAEDLVAQLETRALTDYTMYASHPMSTCRMGTDPATSVIRPDGRAHALDGLWLADSSIFPTSLGVNPSITTMAMGTIIGRGIAG